MAISRNSRRLRWARLLLLLAAGCRGTGSLGGQGYCIRVNQSAGDVTLPAGDDAGSPPGVNVVRIELSNRDGGFGADPSQASAGETAPTPPPMQVEPPRP
jgi:hypothetical protein